MGRLFTYQGKTYRLQGGDLSVRIERPGRATRWQRLRRPGQTARDLRRLLQLGRLSPLGERCST